MLAQDLAVQMLTAVANGLGEELLPKVAFVGGCTTALHVTDELALQSIRFTDDVDLIVSIMSKSHWREVRSLLLERGFSESIQDDVICRMRYGELIYQSLVSFSHGVSPLCWLNQRRVH